MNRRHHVAALFALSALALGGGSRDATAQSLEKPKLTIAVGGKASIYYLPLTIAEQKGYFKDEGLTVEIVDFAGGSQSLRAVVGGSADVVSGAFEHTINLQASKQYFRAFVLQGRAPAIAVPVCVATAPHGGATRRENRSRGGSSHRHVVVRHVSEGGRRVGACTAWRRLPSATCAVRPPSLPADCREAGGCGTRRGGVATAPLGERRVGHVTNATLGGRHDSQRPDVYVAKRDSSVRKRTG